MAIPKVPTGKTLQERNEQKEIMTAEVVRAGDKLILPTNPRDMSADEAIAQLQRFKQSEEEAVNMRETYDAFPWDGAHALKLALGEIYGWFNMEPTPNFFGKNPPTMISVEVAPGQTKPIPWGRFSVPNIPSAEGYLETGVTMHQQRQVFMLTASIRRKYEAEFKRIADKVREVLSTASLYRGKAFRLHFTEENSILGGSTKAAEASFMRLSGKETEMLVLPRDVERQVATNLFTPIERMEDIRRFGMPIKRGIGLAGRFGVGKTMIASACAERCVKNNMTFIMCNKASDFADALRFATQYQPAMVFAEDIDRVLSGSRTVSMDNILNTVDGIESKGSEIIVVLTTNSLETINEAMLRPGRLDAIIVIKSPDAEAVERLIRQYAQGRLEEGIDLTHTGEILQGQIPAVIAEAVQRAKLAQLKLSPVGVQPDDFRLSAAALEEAAMSMVEQVNMLSNRPVEETEKDRFARVHGTAIGMALRGSAKARDLATNTKNNGRSLDSVEAELAELVEIDKAA
jgi:transitional endoplasmic reticulum ATPase